MSIHNTWMFLSLGDLPPKNDNNKHTHTHTWWLLFWSPFKDHQKMGYQHTRTQQNNNNNNNEAPIVSGQAMTRSHCWGFCHFSGLAFCFVANWRRSLTWPKKRQLADFVVPTACPPFVLFRGSSGAFPFNMGKQESQSGQGQRMGCVKRSPAHKTRVKRGTWSLHDPLKRSMTP